MFNKKEDNDNMLKDIQNQLGELIRHQTKQKSSTDDDDKHVNQNTELKLKIFELQQLWFGE